MKTCETPSQKLLFRHLLFWGSLLVLGCTMVAIFRPTVPALIYQEKPIDVWFEYLPVTVAGFDGTNYLAYSATTISADGHIWGSSDAMQAATALEAFESFGTNSIPFLMAKLRHHDLLPERLIQRTCYEVGIDCRILPFRPAHIQVAQATDALWKIGKLPENVLTELSHLKDSKYKATRDSAGYILQEMERLKR